MWLVSSRPFVVPVPEFGPVSRALLASFPDIDDDRALAELMCKACVAGVDVDSASLSVLTTTQSWETMAATDATARLLEDLQFTLNEGICLEAATSGVPVLVPDLRKSASARWPVYAAAVVERTSVEAIFAIPLQWGTINLGVLVLYRDSVGILSDAQWRDVLNAVDMLVLLMLKVGTDPVKGGENWLRLSVGARAEIHQATGMVLVQLGVSAPEALARMRAYAFAEERLLTEVARDVVSGRMRFTPDMP